MFKYLLVCLALIFWPVTLAIGVGVVWFVVDNVQSTPITHDPELARLHDQLETWAREDAASAERAIAREKAATRRMASPRALRGGLTRDELMRLPGSHPNAIPKERARRAKVRDLGGGEL